MLNPAEQKFVKIILPFAITLVIILLVIIPGPSNWRNSFFLDHDYPFDFISWESLYVSESTGRISSLALISLFPNLLISQIFHGTWEFFQSFFLKIFPLFIFTYLFSKCLVSSRDNLLINFQGILFIFVIIFLLQFNIVGLMFLNSGIFYNLMVQACIYLFTFHFYKFQQDPDSIFSQRGIYLSALTLQTAIIVGSLVVPIGIYLAIIYSVKLNRVANKKNICIFFGLICSALFFYLLTRIHNISLDTRIDEIGNFVLNRGYENISGGYFYQFIGYSNWGIYTSWNDRLIGGFVSFYQLPSYQLSLFFLSSASVFYLIKSKSYRILIILGTFILFAAGNQPPFGGIFVWFVDHIPGFQSIRTPDNKFGPFIQIIFLICLVDSWSWYRTIWKNFILAALVLVTTINIVPIMNGSVIFGKNSQFSPSSSFVLDISYEKKLLSYIKPEDFLMIIPGNGNFDHPSGRAGFLDPLFHIHKNIISYNAARIDEQSKYSQALKAGDYSNLMNVNVIVLRKSEKFLDQKKVEGAGFKKIYEDQYSSVFRAPPKIISLSYQAKYLIYIALVGVFLYGFLVWLIYRLFNEQK